VDRARWGFEEADDWEYEQLNSRSAPAPNPVDEPTETLVGQDSDGVVAVVVSPEGEVCGWAVTGMATVGGPAGLAQPRALRRERGDDARSGP
jgi:hypothetical protein